MTNKIEKLFANMMEYNQYNVGDEFPLDSLCFYHDIWNDWRNDNKISLVDAISLWDYMMKSDWIQNTTGEYDEQELEYKELWEKIRLLKKDCDF